MPLASDEVPILPPLNTSAATWPTFRVENQNCCGDGPKIRLARTTVTNKPPITADPPHKRSYDPTMTKPPKPAVATIAAAPPMASHTKPPLAIKRSAGPRGVATPMVTGTPKALGVPSLPLSSTPTLPPLKKRHPAGGAGLHVPAFAGLSLGQRAMGALLAGMAALILLVGLASSIASATFILTLLAAMVGCALGISVVQQGSLHDSMRSRAIVGMLLSVLSVVIYSVALTHR